jgi:hypothetical protein
VFVATPASAALLATALAVTAVAALLSLRVRG